MFLANKHDERDAYICPYEDTKRADNQASWLIKKGQDLSTSVDRHTKLAFHTNFNIGASRMAKVDLIASDLDSPPQRSVHEVGTSLS